MSSENNSAPPSIPSAPPPFAAGRTAAIGNLPVPAPPTQPQHGSGPASAAQQQNQARFGSAKAGNLFAQPGPSISQQQTPSGFGALQRTGSTLGQQSLNPQQATTTQQTLTAADLGVKFVDTGKTNITEEDRKGWKSFRALVAKEILTTERTYVEQLKMMMTVYHDPYVSGKGGTGLTDKKIAALFTLPKVIINVATTFLAELEIYLDKWEEKEEIAPVFLKYYPMFRTYKDYAVGHQQNILLILKKINSRSGFPAFQEKQMKTLMCQDLASYLIMPIQRIPRYRMLIESIISKTESTSPQAQLLLQALKGISEVANSVNEAMKAAQLVQRYMDVQKMFDSNGELVHLWRKLIHEIPCKITRLWQQHSPQREDKPREKKEKKHKFVGSDATLFVFTDCVYLGIKDPSRCQKYEETRNQEIPYPLFAGEYQYKFSLLSLGVTSLSQSSEPFSVTINGDHTYHHTLLLTSPVHAVAVTFDTYQNQQTCLKQLQQAQGDFPQMRQDCFVDTPANNKTGEVLCCDNCSTALYNYTGGAKEGLVNYISIKQYFCCNKCNNVTCPKCLHVDPTKETSPAPPGRKLVGGVSMTGLGGMVPQTPTSKTSKMFSQVHPSYPLNPAHHSFGFNVLEATGRTCKGCEEHKPKIVPNAPAGGESAEKLRLSVHPREDAMRQSTMALPGLTSPSNNGSGMLSQSDLSQIKLRSTRDATASPNVSADSNANHNLNSTSQSRNTQPPITQHTFKQPEAPAEEEGSHHRNNSTPSMGAMQPPPTPKHSGPPPTPSVHQAGPPPPPTPTLSSAANPSVIPPPTPSSNSGNGAQPPAVPTFLRPGSTTGAILPPPTPSMANSNNSSVHSSNNNSNNNLSTPLVPPPAPSNPNSLTIDVMDAEDTPAATPAAAPAPAKLSPRSQFRLRQKQQQQQQQAIPPPPADVVPPPPSPSHAAPILPPPSPMNGAPPPPPPPESPTNASGGALPPPPPPSALPPTPEDVTEVKAISVVPPPPPDAFVANNSSNNNGSGSMDPALLPAVVVQPQPAQVVKRNDALAPKMVKKNISIDDEAPVTDLNTNIPSPGAQPSVVSPPPLQITAIQPPPQPTPSGGFKPPMGFRAPISKQ